MVCCRSQHCRAWECWTPPKVLGVIKLFWSSSHSHVWRMCVLSLTASSSSSRKRFRIFLIFRSKPRGLHVCWSRGWWERDEEHQTTSTAPTPFSSFTFHQQYSTVVSKFLGSTIFHSGICQKKKTGQSKCVKTYIKLYTSFFLMSLYHLQTNPNKPSQKFSFAIQIMSSAISFATH